MGPMVLDSSDGTTHLFRQVIVWDNHACMPLRPSMNGFYRSSNAVVRPALPPSL